MSFVAECPICRDPIRADGTQEGLNIRCGRCGTSFTATQDSHLPPPSAESETEPEDGGRWQAEPCGAVALLCAAGALLAATVSGLCPVVLPLAGLGLLLGLVGFRRNRGVSRAYPLPAAGSGLSALTLLAGVFAPSWLAPAYQTWRERSHADAEAVRAVPLSAGEDVVASQTEWVDASRYVLQQGAVRVQVSRVSVGPIEEQAAAPRARKAEPQLFLIVRLRARVTAGGKEFAGPGWGEQGPRKQRPEVRVTDDAGRAFELRPAPSMLAAGGEGTRSAMFPVGVAEDVFLFSPPLRAVEWLRIEVPASAWAGSGVFRFTVPGSMIQWGPQGPPAGP